ncbi:MAG: substrate-binding domain-containing protein, partial [Sphingomicrobium sp.]
TGERDPIIIPGDFSEASGAEAAHLLLAGRLPVDAIFCANDMMAIGCCSVLADADIAIGEQIGVAGFDDIPIAHYVTPSLTTMNARTAELGATAARKLIEILAGGHDAPGATILSPLLVERDSTRRAVRAPRTEQLIREIQQENPS